MNIIKPTFPKWNAISINMPMICRSFKLFFGIASSSEHPHHEPDTHFRLSRRSCLVFNLLDTR